MRRCQPTLKWASWLPRVAGGLAFALVLVVVSLSLAQEQQKKESDTKDAKKAPDVTGYLSTDPAAAMELDKKIIAEGKNGTQVLATLSYLSDVIGHRLTGSPALKRANEWTAKRMESFGLTNVHLEAWSIPTGWERGFARGRIIVPENGREITMASYAWTPGTKGKIVGEVVYLQARTTEDLAKYKGKLKNAIIMRSPPTPMRPLAEMVANAGLGGPGGGQRGNRGGRRGGGDNQQPPGQGGQTPARGGQQEKGVQPPGRGGQQEKGGQPNQLPRNREFGGFNPGFQRELNEFLKNEGAAAVLLDSQKPHGLLNMTGNWRGGDRASAGDPLPMLFVTNDHYSLLYRLATSNDGSKTKMELEVDAKFVPGPIAVYNTVGEIKGSEKPDEFVVVGAHLDSWDLGQGTTDNGTGSSCVLEAARIISKLGIKPKRTIRFVLFTGEEQGLHGSRAYVKDHKDELAKTSFCIVHDYGTGRVTGLPTQGRAILKPIFEAELLPSLKDLGVKEVTTGRMGGTDHLSFETGGVPGMAVLQDSAEYRFTHHSQSDTLDKAREPDLIQGSQVLALVAVRVANLPKLLPRQTGREDVQE